MLAKILAELAALAPLLEPEVLNLEGQAMTELNTVIASVSSPDLKALLSALASAIDGFAKGEIQKL